MQRLPLEVHELILSYCGHFTLKRMRLTGRGYWHNLTVSQLWHSLYGLGFLNTSLIDVDLAYPAFSFLSDSPALQPLRHYRETRATAP